MTQQDLTAGGRFLTLWGIMDKHFKPYAGMIAQELSLLASAEDALRNSPEEEAEISAGFLKQIHNSAEMLLIQATELGLNLSKGRAAWASLQTIQSPANRLELLNSLRGLRETMMPELFTVKFMPVTREMEEYADMNQPFGKAVEAAFPESVDDILEAHQCLAFARYTAAMFHLGRAMESATKRFAKRIKAKTPTRDEWQRWLNSINEVVNAMPHASPAQREKREPYAEAAAYFLHFKEAWRNKTMHPLRS